MWTRGSLGAARLGLQGWMYVAPCLTLTSMSFVPPPVLSRTNIAQIHLLHPWRFRRSVPGLTSQTLRNLSISFGK